MLIDLEFLTLLSTAFATGLLGSLHCVGMCGGIASALGMSQTIKPNQHAFIYQMGRISSYAIAGAIAGSLGQVATQGMWLKEFSIVIRIISALFVVGLGLYIAGWFPYFSKIERIGLPIWKKISPLSKKLVPVKNGYQAYILGGLWGWLPCGLTYSMLLWAISATSVINAALVMIVFGLGTLPAMLSVTLGSGKISTIVAKPIVRKIAGLVMIMMGAYLIQNIVLMLSHVHHH